MNTRAFFPAVAVLLLVLNSAAFALEPEDALASAAESSPPPPAPGIFQPEDEAAEQGGLAFAFSEGLTVSWLTRIAKQTGRSNFVLKDFLPGIYIGAELLNLKYVAPVVRLAAYYPLASTFNAMPQKPNTPLHYGADLFAGLSFSIDKLKYLRLNFGPGLHLFYLNSDRWNYLNAGIAGTAGLEAPLTMHWTLLINGYASFDNGNLGSNRDMEPFDIVYQYHVDIGVRFSKKLPNREYWFAPANR